MVGRMREEDLMNMDFSIGEVLVNAVLHRDPQRSLVTTANHHSCKIFVDNYSYPFSIMLK